VAVLDFAMPLLNGVDTAAEIARVSDRTRVVLLTMHMDERYVFEVLRAGVRGYVVKTQAATDLAQAIHDAARGLVYLSSSVCQAVVRAYLARTELPEDPLTPRDREVLQLVAEGKRTKQIAELLAVSLKTAETHRVQSRPLENLLISYLICRVTGRRNPRYLRVAASKQPNVSRCGRPPSSSRRLPRPPAVPVVVGRPGTSPSHGAPQASCTRAPSLERRMNHSAVVVR
jgi:FixJ family two-component response regulator